MSEPGPGKVDDRQAEDRLGLLSVLQELTVSALDLFDPEKSPDAFLERVAERLGCPVALCLAVEAGSAPTLLGAVGLARASRGLPLRVDAGSWESRPLPYPETALPGLRRWCFALPGPRTAGVREWVLLLFLGDAAPLSRQVRGMLERLTSVLGTALLHRWLFARTLESERRLREQKALLECQSEASLDGVLILSPEGKVLFHNRRLAELWGLPADLRRFGREAISTAMASRVEDPATFLARSEEIWRSDNDLRVRDQVRLRDGRVLERHCAPVQGDDGVRWGRGCFWRDVTARQRVEQELRQERDFSAAILDTVGALVLVLDREGRIVRLNGACQRATGYGQEELRGEPIWQRLVPSTNAAEIGKAFLGRQGEGQPEPGEIALSTRDGGVRRISWATSVLAEQREEQFLICTGIDVTEQRRAEAERDRLLAGEQTARALAEERERRAELLAEASGILGSTLELPEALGRLARVAVPRLGDVCVIDVQGGGGELERLAVAFHDPGHTELARRIQASLPDLRARRGPGAVLRTGELCRCGEPDCGGDALAGVSGAVIDLAGPWVFRSYLSAPMLARGRILGAFTLGMVREGRHYDATDIEVCQELARRAALAVDSAWLYREARAAVRARDEFISIASHDLRSPVTALRLAVHTALAASRTGVAPSERLQRSLSMIDRQERRIARLIEDLLDVTRAQAGTLEVELQPVDLAALAREVAGRFAAEVAEAGTGSEITVRADTYVVGSWDRSRLDQVLTNLLTNALKFGEGKPVEVEVSSGGGRARLWVRDHGGGIPLEEQGKIFERFHRLATAEPHPGLGLGLYIVRQIVERLGGEVRVESRPGEGALFEVDLPCGEPPADVPAPGPAGVEPGPEAAPPR